MIGSPRSARMSMPRGPPLRRRPKAELPAPAGGPRKPPRAPANSGPPSTQSTGAPRPPARGPGAPAPPPPWRGARRRARPRAARARPSRLEAREADVEAREASGRDHPSHVDRAHLGQRGSFLERPHELLDHLARPLGPRSHAAVLEVHDIADEAETLGMALGIVAIAHPLHATLDDDLGSDGHGCSGWSGIAAPPAGWRRPTGGERGGRGERI